MVSFKAAQPNKALKIRQTHPSTKISPAGSDRFQPNWAKLISDCIVVHVTLSLSISLSLDLVRVAYKVDGGDDDQRRICEKMNDDSIA